MPSHISSSGTIAKNSLYLYIRMIVLMVVSLYTVRVVINVLGIEGYGIYSAVSGIVLSFSFLSITLASSAQRYFSVDIGLNQDDQISDTFSVVCLTYLFLGVILAVLLESLGIWFLDNKMTIPQDQLPDAKFLFHCSVLTFIATIFTNPFYALIISYERMNIYAYMSLFEAFLKLGVAFSIEYICFNKLKLYGLLLLAVSLLVLFFYFIICKVRFPFIKFRILNNSSKIKDILNFSSWSLFGTLAGAANGQFLNILLNLFYGPIANAAYAIGHQVSGVLGQITNSFYSAVRPPLTKSYAINDWDQTNYIFYFSSKVTFVLLFLILVPLYIEMETILSIWLGKVDEYMVSVSQLLLINISIICLSNPITTIIQAANAVKRYHLIVDGFILLSLPIIYLSMKCGVPPEIVFVISNIFLIIAHFIRLQLLKKCFAFSIGSYLKQFLIPVILIIILDFSISLAVHCFILHVWIRVFSVIVVSVITILISSFYLLLSVQERKIICNKVCSLLNI